MSGTLFSPIWYRVADLRPRLHFDVRVESQHYRDQAWHLLIDNSTGRQFRVNLAAYGLIGRLNGEATVQEVWDALLRDNPDGAPTQDEVVQLLTQLTERELIEGGSTDVPKPAPRKRPVAHMVNPFVFSIPLGDPWALLQRVDGLLKFATFRGAVWVWLAAVSAAGLAGALHWHELTQAAQGSRWPWLAWLLFPFFKTVHELAHGLAVKHFGGEVHKAGVTLFFLTPAPYVDASGASAFRSRRARVLVGAAGMMAELTLAALAMLVWLNAQPGLLHDLAFAALFSASVSALLFNGNPLLRFDAYFIFTDLLELPNLAQRSAAWWGQQLRVVLRAAPGPALQPAKGETKWLVAYAPFSLAYRLALSVGIVVWLAEWSMVLGLAAAVFSVATICTPWVKGAARLIAEQRRSAEHRHVPIMLMGGALLAALLLFVLPLPLFTAASGVVWLPDQARVRPDTGGFVAHIKARDGMGVKAGDVLVELFDPVLEAERERFASRAGELSAELYAAMTSGNFERSARIEQDVASNDAELRRLEQRLAGLVVTSNVDGTLVLPRSADLPGTWVERGATIGYVFDRERIVVRAAIDQQDAALVRDSTRHVSVRLAEAPDERLEATQLRDVPAATTELPSAALGDMGGGPHVTDPEDKKGLRVLQPVVLVDLALPQGLDRVGSRAWVRFDHGSEPLAMQLYRYGRRVFLSRFNPGQ